MQPIHTYTVYDIETTGLSAACMCEIIEFAGIKLDQNLNIMDTMHIYIKPYAKIPAKIVTLTGITDEQVFGCENRYQALPKIRNFIGNSVSVCHNAQFDTSFISTMCVQQGLEVLGDWICTMKSYKKLTGEKSAKLANVCERYGISLEHAHTALDDAMATVEVFIRLISEYSIEQLHKQSASKQSTTISVLKVIGSQNPNKKVREELCAEYAPTKQADFCINQIVDMFERGCDPIAVAASLELDSNKVSTLFGAWLTAKRMPKFVKLEEMTLNRQVRTMIGVCSTFEDLIKLHKEIYGNTINKGLYLYHWIKNKGLLGDVERIHAFNMLLSNAYPIEKIVSVFPELKPCEITLKFCEYAISHRNSARAYIASSLCGKSALSDALALDGGRHTDEQIRQDPSLIRIAVTVELYNRGFFKITTVGGKTA